MFFRLNGFDSVEGQRALAQAEQMIKEIYHK